MQKKLTFNKFAGALSAMAATTLTAGAAVASPIQASETEVARLADEGSSELGDEKKEEKKKKKKKDDGDEGGCGAGTCG